MEERSEIVPVRLASGKTVQVEATVLGAEEDVAFTVPAIEGLGDAIEGIADSIMKSLSRIKPKKATVEFGVEVAVEAGQLTALLVKGTGNASIKVILEWGTD